MPRLCNHLIVRKIRNARLGAAKPIVLPPKRACFEPQNRLFCSVLPHNKLRKGVVWQRGQPSAAVYQPLHGLRFPAIPQRRYKVCG